MGELWGHPESGWSRQTQLKILLKPKEKLKLPESTSNEPVNAVPVKIGKRVGSKANSQKL